MYQDFMKILQENNLLVPGTHVLLAVSGGVDSMVLFHLMRTLPREKRPKISVAHVNHQLRPEADGEEAFVEKLANQYGIPFYAFRWDKSTHPKSGLEEAARNIRYTFFKQIMQKNHIPLLMTAHHQDDQVETILMKLVRGSTLAQLTGIQFAQPFAKGKLIRPLLDFSKQELYRFAGEQNLAYLEDQTNFESTYTRNRFRNEIIPLLQEENSQFDQHLVQFAADLGDLLEVSKDAIAEQFKNVTSQKNNIIQLDIAGFSELSKACQSLVLKKVLDTVYRSEDHFYKSNYIHLIQDWIINGSVNTQLDLQSGMAAKKDYTKISFSKKDKLTYAVKDQQHRIHHVNQWVQLSPTEKMSLVVLKDDDAKAFKEDEQTLVIGADSLYLPLTIRHRRPGDRMRYAGLNGSKKIKDIFIDEKIPPEKRDQAWIVEDSRGVILWLVPLRKMNLYPAEETDKLTYVLKYKKD